MNLIIQRKSSSALNPNAPSFVPLAYRSVEDFSDQWWALVQSSPWFRDYWLQERYQDPLIDAEFLDNDDLPDVDAMFDDYCLDDDKSKLNQLTITLWFSLRLDIERSRVDFSTRVTDPSR